MEELKNEILKEIEKIRKVKAESFQDGIILNSRIITLKDVLKMIEELDKARC